MRHVSVRESGHSLIELLVVLAISAIISTLALPSLEVMLQSARQRERVTAFVVSAQLARGEALRRGHPVTLCPSTDGETCGKSLADGWIVFDDPRSDRRRDADDALLDRYAAPRAGLVRATITHYTWRAYGRRGTNGTVVFCDGGGGTRSRAVVIPHTGRPRVANRMPGGKPLPC